MINHVKCADILKLPQTFNAQHKELWRYCSNQRPPDLEHSTLTTAPPRSPDNVYSNQNAPFHTSWNRPDFDSAMRVSATQIYGIL
jgi:hypothetical protein